MFALILFTLPKQPLNVTGVNLTVVHPTKIPSSTSLGWGFVGVVQGVWVYMGYVQTGYAKGVWLCSGYVEQVEG